MCSLKFPLSASSPSLVHLGTDHAPGDHIEHHIGLGSVGYQERSEPLRGWRYFGLRLGGESAKNLQLARPTRIKSGVNEMGLPSLSIPGWRGDSHGMKKNSEPVITGKFEKMEAKSPNSLRRCSIR